MLTKYERLAEVLVKHSTQVKKGEKVIINMGGTEAWPLVKAVYREIIKRGAGAEILFNHSQLTRDLLKYGHHRQLLRTPGVEKFS
ncbi:MAG: aminopeptidase, partial [bacterium]|nr:aminopeptidase [bacterium]